MSAIFPTYARWDVTVKEGRGSIIVDTNDKEYLDFTSGIAVCNLGHCNEKVVEALKKQADQLWHISNLFHIPIQEDVAQALTKSSCGDYVFFCNSGAEANEAAIKLARKYTQKSKIISFKQSFHGRTLGSMSATGQDKIKIGFGPLLEKFVYADYNNISSVKELIDEDVAAIMLEVIQGEGGVNVGDSEFIEEIGKLCKDNNILLVVDEVQTGIARTGKPFGYQHFNIEPDIISLAKGLGSGFPVGAIIGKEKLKDAFNAGSHGSTFGGNPLAMAAAKATLEIAFDEQFLNQVKEKGDLLVKTLSERLASNNKVVKIQGKGLMVGIECTFEVAPMLATLREKGLLALNAGPNVIRLLPPLTISNEELLKGIDLLCSEF